MQEVLTGGLTNEVLSKNTEEEKFSVVEGLKTETKDLKMALHFLTSKNPEKLLNGDEEVPDALKSKGENLLVYEFLKNFNFVEFMGSLVTNPVESFTHIGSATAATLSTIGMHIVPATEGALHTATNLISQYPAGVAAVASLVAANKLIPFLKRQHNLLPEERQSIKDIVNNKMQDLKTAPKRFFESLHQDAKRRTEPVLQMISGKSYSDYKNLFERNDIGPAEKMVLSFTKNNSHESEMGKDIDNFFTKLKNKLFGKKQDGCSDNKHTAPFNTDRPKPMPIANNQNSLSSQVQSLCRQYEKTKDVANTKQQTSGNALFNLKKLFRAKKGEVR